MKMTYSYRYSNKKLWTYIKNLKKDNASIPPLRWPR